MQFASSTNVGNIFHKIKPFCKECISKKSRKRSPSMKQAVSLISDISRSTTDLKLKLCTHLEYGGGLMPILFSRSRGSVIQMAKVGNHDSLPTVTPKNQSTLYILQYVLYITNLRQVNISISLH